MTDNVPREALQQQILDLHDVIAIKDAQIMERAAELAQIRALMHQVTVYEGLVDVSPLVMMVSDLVADHDRLESRIDLVISYIKSYEGPIAEPMIDEIVHLLRGGSPVPNDISSLEDGA